MNWGFNILPYCYCISLLAIACSYQWKQFLYFQPSHPSFRAQIWANITVYKLLIGSYFLVTQFYYSVLFTCVCFRLGRFRIWGLISLWCLQKYRKSPWRIPCLHFSLLIILKSFKQLNPLFFPQLHSLHLCHTPQYLSVFFPAYSYCYIWSINTMSMQWVFMLLKYHVSWWCYKSGL